MSTLQSFALAVLFIGALVGSAHAEGPAIANLTVIPLTEGANAIEDFLLDGRPIEIIKGWHDSGNARGYWVFMTMIARAKPEKGWELVGIDHDGQQEDTLKDFPHMGIDYIKSVRYAYGTIDGNPAIVLIIATRDFMNTKSLSDASKITLDIYALSTSNTELGSTPYTFRKIKTQLSLDSYCNSDLALHNMLNLPLPSDYVGTTPDGCS